MVIKCKWPKYSKILKNDQNTPKSQNYQNNHETYKITKIPPKLKKKETKISQKPKNDQNIPKTQKITTIPPKHKNYQNTPETHKMPLKSL